jgi:monothiol glutaredoxin
MRRPAQRASAATGWRRTSGETRANAPSLDAGPRRSTIRAMADADPAQSRIAALVQSDTVVLFMKGTRSTPQCGFSATVVGILDKYVPEYTTVNVLEDPEIREGVKAFSEWPTIPQLYVRGEFVGGCDIVRELDSSGDLLSALGDAAVAPEPPAITVTPAAVAVFEEAMSEAGPGDVLRISIDAGFHHDLALGPREPADVEVKAGGLVIALDPGSARRAAGLTIDYVDGVQSGFKMDNPNAPAQVKQVPPTQVKEWLDAGEPLHFFDVRTEAERRTASIEGTTLLDKGAFEAALKLPKDAKLVFHCHHGMRSFQAAEHFARQGFRNVFNVAGGIDAWSAQVDDSIPRY